MIVAEIFNGNHLQQLKKLKLFAYDSPAFLNNYGFEEEQIKQLIKALPELKEFDGLKECVQFESVKKETFDSLCKFVKENNLDLVLT